MLGFGGAGLKSSLVLCLLGKVTGNDIRMIQHKILEYYFLDADEPGHPGFGKVRGSPFKFDRASLVALYRTAVALCNKDIALFICARAGITSAPTNIQKRFAGDPFSRKCHCPEIRFGASVILEKHGFGRFIPDRGARLARVDGIARPAGMVRRTGVAAG